MGTHFNISIRFLLIFSIILGIIYPLSMVAIGQLIFPKTANGSIISIKGRRVGSELIAQDFRLPKYFHSRPSKAGEGYDGQASSGSNLGPTSQKLVDYVNANINTVYAENRNLTSQNLPIDMVTASASGLDPDISIANAYLQAKRVAIARSVLEQNVKEIINANITPRQFGILGEPRVNVLKINLALDRSLIQSHE